MLYCNGYRLLQCREIMDMSTYLTLAEQHCDQRGGKLTALRRHVLQIVLRYDGVVKAYQVLADLQKERGVTAPPTVYRALDFLVEQQLLHRVEALNGFIVCRHFQCDHTGLILACERCGKVTEVEAFACLSALREVTAAVQFIADPQRLLVTGRCEMCNVHKE